MPEVAEDEYDDHSVVVKHHGQRLLPVLQLRCRWRKPAGHSRLMSLVCTLPFAYRGRTWLADALMFFMRLSTSSFDKRS